MKEKTIEKNLTPTEMFNLNDLSDLSTKLSNEIKKTEPTIKNKFVQLLEIKSPLTVDEFIVGLYRVYGIERSRNVTQCQLYQCVKKSLIEKVEGKIGLYQKCRG